MTGKGVAIAGDRQARQRRGGDLHARSARRAKVGPKVCEHERKSGMEAVMVRAPQLAVLKLLGGRSPGRDSGGRTVPDVPRFERSAPQPPDWLSEQARAVWEATAPTLEALKLMNPEDGLIFTVICETWSTYLDALTRV